MTKTPRKLMVTIKLELADAVRIRWLDAQGKPGKPWKARLRAVRLPDSVTVPVDSKHVTETTVPVKGAADRFDVFFMGYFELEPGDPNHARLAGKKKLAVEYDWGYVDEASGRWAEAGTEYEVVTPGKKATLSAMG